MQTSTDENKALMRRFEQAMNARELEALDEILAPDVVRHCQATPHIAVTNRHQFKDFLRQDTAAFPDSVQTFVRIVCEGEWVAVWATYEGTQTGAMGPFPPSGKKALFDFAMVLRVDAGKIAESWVTWDNLAILGQLGHLPPPPDAGS